MSRPILQDPTQNHTLVFGGPIKSLHVVWDLYLNFSIVWIWPYIIVIFEAVVEF